MKTRAEWAIDSMSYKSEAINCFSKMQLVDKKISRPNICG